MSWIRTRGWGLYVIVMGLISFISVFDAESVVLMILYVILGTGLIYHGVSMVRTGSNTPYHKSPE